ncbi:MAG TPA: hypothetical protein VI685_14870, partial [Candidatus Angelobacter sp.]
MLQVSGGNAPAPQLGYGGNPGPARAAAPTLRSTSPSSRQAGRFNVDLYGSNFQAGAKVVVSGNGRSDQNSQVMYESAGHLQTALDLSVAGSYNLSIRNPDGQMSNSVALQVVPGNSPLQPQPTYGNTPVPVRAPAPSLRNLAPADHAAGNFTLDLYGDNFQTRAKVVVNGNGHSDQNSQVRYDNAGHLQTVLDLSSPGAYSLSVRNPDGQLSNAVALQITAIKSAPTQPTYSNIPAPVHAAAPALRSVSPASHASGRFTVDLYGSNFQAGGKVVVSGSGRSGDSSSMRFDNAGHLQAVLDVSTAGVFTLAVRNSDGQISNSVALQVTAMNTVPTRPTYSNIPAPTHASVPTLRSVSPASHVSGLFTVDLYGSNFQAGSKVVVNGSGRSNDSSSVRFDNAEHLQATLDLNAAGAFTLAVRNSDGQVSSAIPLQVTTASGSSNVNSPPAKTASLITGVSAINASCAGAVDEGYSISFQGRTYKVKGIGQAGPTRVPLFFDERNGHVTDRNLLATLTAAAWTRENVVTAPDARNGARDVSAILSTSQDLYGYSVAQDAVARALAEALKAGITGGASLSTAIPSVTRGMLRNQMLNAPRTVLLVAAHHGLLESQGLFNQMLAVPLPPANDATLKAEDLAKIRVFYIQARTLQLPYQALTAKLMPTKAD